VIEFVFMLTHHDATVPDAARVLADLRGSGLRYVGFKDVGAPPAALSELTAGAHERGMEVMLEVVSVSAEDELRSIAAATEIGVDWVLGGTHHDEALRELAGSGLRYCPFPGRVEGHPSVLHGSIAEIAEHARALTARPGVHGLDLLAYRHASEDPVALTRAVVEAADGPVIAAGSVTSLEQIRALDAVGAWGFTIGGAIFEGRLPSGPGVTEQVRAVLAELEATGARER
jgi:DhnA family fructose-bisphosphate aldolase class Ia